LEASAYPQNPERAGPEYFSSPGYYLYASPAAATLPPAYPSQFLLFLTLRSEYHQGTENIGWDIILKWIKEIQIDLVDWIDWVPDKPL
jgi:hypothetical protein